MTYKTAWRMFKQIRTMLSADGDTPLGGKRGQGVEIDETYVGGRQATELVLALPTRTPRPPVVGVVERKGRVRAYTTVDVKKRHHHGHYQGTRPAQHDGLY